MGSPYMKLRLTLTLAVAAVFLAVGVANAGPITISSAAVGGDPSPASITTA